MAPVGHGLFGHGRDLVLFHPHIPQAGGQSDGRGKTGNAHAGLLCGLGGSEGIDFFSNFPVFFSVPSLLSVAKSFLSF
jgi:hypothetical protein